MIGSFDLEKHGFSRKAYSIGRTRDMNYYGWGRICPLTFNSVTILEHKAPDGTSLMYLGNNSIEVFDEIKLLKYIEEHLPARLIDHELSWDKRGEGYTAKSHTLLFKGKEYTIGKKNLYATINIICSELSI